MLWTEELDNELRNLHDEYVAMEEKPDGTLPFKFSPSSNIVLTSDIDVIDFAEHNLSKPRNRKQIIKQMKQLGLHTFGAKPTKRSVILFEK